MSIFGTIMDKIFHHGKAQAAEPEAAPTSAAQAPASTPAAAPAPAAPAKLSDSDVNATLIRLAAQKGGGGNWRTSIVDLLKLLDLDSSLTARKQLAQELNVHAGADGTAEQNIALSKAVMQKLAENGGQVPDSLRN